MATKPPPAMAERGLIKGISYTFQVNVTLVWEKADLGYRGRRNSRLGRSVGRVASRRTQSIQQRLRRRYSRCGACPGDQSHTRVANTLW